MAKAKKVKPVKEETTRLWVAYRQHRSGGDVCAGDEDSAWPSYEDTFIETSFRGVYVGEDRPAEITWQDDAESFEVPKAGFEKVARDKVYVVVARYGDGDTFSHSNGNIHIGGVFGTYDAAKREIEALKSKEKGDYSVPWNGYFNSLDTLEVEILPILGQTGASNPAEDW